MVKEQRWTCYLATPIDQVREGEWTEDFTQGSGTFVVPSGQLIADIRAQLKSLLEEAGAAVYDPQGAWNARPLPAMSEVNDVALRNCDSMLAYLPDGVASIGVPVEVERASVLGKPVYLLGGDAVMNSPMWGHNAPTVSVMDIDVVDLRIVVGLVRNAALLQHSRKLPPPLRFIPTGDFSQWDRLEGVPTSRPKAPSTGATWAEHTSGKADSRMDEWAKRISQMHGASIGEQPGEEPDPVRVMQGARAVIDHTGFLEAVKNEVDRADIKYPFSDSLSMNRWFGIWAEEVIEVYNAWNDHQNPEAFTGGKTLEDVAEELIQVGAMSLRFWQSVRRVGDGPTEER